MWQNFTISSYTLLSKLGIILEWKNGSYYISSDGAHKLNLPGQTGTYGNPNYRVSEKTAYIKIYELFLEKTYF